MSLKHVLFMFILLFSCISASFASGFEWRSSLNLRAQSDPYGYRYDLMHRFARDESSVISILRAVYEPADAYMIFRLAELSGYSPEYVLGVYDARRAYGWHDIASVLGIHTDRHEFVLFRQGHDITNVYYTEHYRRQEHYLPPVQHHYVPQPKKYYAPVYTHPAPKPHVPAASGKGRVYHPEPRPRPPHHHVAHSEPRKYEAHHPRAPRNDEKVYAGEKRHH